MPMKFYNERQSGGILARIITDIDAVQNLFADRLLHLINHSIVAITVIGILFYLDWKLVLLASIIIPLFLLIFGVLMKEVYKTSMKLQERQEALLGNLQEDILGIKLTQSFTSEEHREKKAHKNISDTEKEKRALQIKDALASMSTISISVLAVTIMWGYGGYSVIKETMTIGTLIAIIYYLNYLYTPLSSIFESNIEIQTSLAAAKRIFEILDTKSGIQEDKDAIELPLIKEKIEFKNVSFSYDSKGVQVLKNINFSAKMNTVIGIVGMSGEGKTTLINLIPRFYDVDKGEIYIDGYNIKKVKLKSLRQQIGLVSQDIFLFNASIRENIIFGRENITEEMFLEAVKIAKVDEFATQLPDGYYTIVGERGVKLSGGQRQRVAIARAILANARILIFDEAISVLDSESEKYIQESINSAIKNRTTFIIAHRLSTILSADEIIVLDKGEIKERGTHAELIKRGGIYKKLYDTQFENVAIG